MKKDKSLTANDKSTNFGIIKSPVTGSEMPTLQKSPYRLLKTLMKLQSSPQKSKLCPEKFIMFKTV
jgi:hypothetical protein